MLIVPVLVLVRLMVADDAARSEPLAVWEMPSLTVATADARTSALAIARAAMSIVPLLVSVSVATFALKAYCSRPKSTDAIAFAVVLAVACAMAWMLIVPEFV